MADKSVPSSAGGGPRDLSEAVHANFAQPPREVPEPGVHLEVHLRLGESEAAKVNAGDLFEAITDLLRRHGVDAAHCNLEAFRSDALAEPQP